jgi:aminoglycoside/choline kinase family phosphotransferase
MTTAKRAAAMDAFLQASGWGDAEVSFLSGDASFRSYQRVTLKGQQAVLMDAPPEKEPLEPFISIAEYLLEQGYSAPKILARDHDEGFLLLEDLGNDLYSAVLKENPVKEAKLYLAATDQLIDMHRKNQVTIDLPKYDETLLLEEAVLFIDWYVAAVLGHEKAAELRPGFLSLWQDIFARAPFLPPVLVLRDYHADNLLWLPERTGIARVGLLDFQDAVIGSPAYDLVSFIEDARRDLQPETAMTVMNYYLQQMRWDADAFRACYAMLGAERNLKIIGIFTRLAIRDQKPHYLELLPRVWNHLLNDIEHPMIRPLHNWLDRHLPDAEQRSIPPFAENQPAPKENRS